MHAGTHTPVHTCHPRASSWLECCSPGSPPPGSPRLAFTFSLLGGVTSDGPKGGILIHRENLTFLTCLVAGSFPEGLGGGCLQDPEFHSQLTMGCMAPRGGLAGNETTARLTLGGWCRALGGPAGAWRAGYSSTTRGQADPGLPAGPVQRRRSLPHSLTHSPAPPAALGALLWVWGLGEQIPQSDF